jgi:hypothetical protein
MSLLDRMSAPVSLTQCLGYAMIPPPSSRGFFLFQGMIPCCLPSLPCLVDVM